MNRVRLGKTDLEISRLVFGSMGRSRQTEAERARVLDAAIDAGLTSIDTAPLYDFGGVESFLGRALAGRRGRVELLSKVGLRWDDEHGEILFEATIAGTRRTVRRDSRPASIRLDVEESLMRLDTDFLDLCQIHHPDRRVPLDDALGELDRLREEGKLRHVGVSNVEPHELATCLAHYESADAERGLASLQLHYSLLERHAEAALLPAVLEQGVGVLAFTPLEAGALSDRALDDDAWARARAEYDPLFRAGNLAAIRAALHDVLRPVSTRARTTSSGVALAWLLAQPAVSAAIVGASSPSQIEENARALDLSLSAEQVEDIGARFAEVEIDRDPGLPLPMRIRRKLGRIRVRLARLAAGRRR